MLSEYNIPIDVSTDVLTTRVDVCDASTPLLYALLMTIDKNKSSLYFTHTIFNTTNGFKESSLSRDEIQKCFDAAKDKDIKYEHVAFSYNAEKQVLKETKPSFPIKWDMVEVSDDQWIGKITVQDLMKLRDARLIKYNENTQRTLKRVINNGFEYYQNNNYQHLILG